MLTGANVHDSYRVPASEEYECTQKRHVIAVYNYTTLRLASGKETPCTHNVRKYGAVLAFSSNMLQHAVFSCTGNTTMNM